ncbi:hypothetical protein Q2T43_18305, partial [Aeromonas veronii]|uniref:hypothetical protein n=1 Tax=Aeromonas veronii TaxID=654 RepID=UPI002666ECA7
QKAPSVAVTWGWGSCCFIVDLGNNALMMASEVPTFILDFLFPMNAEVILPINFYFIHYCII